MESPKPNLNKTPEKSISISEKEKSNGIIAYVTVIGLIIAFMQNKEEKSEYVNFHIRQMIGIFICSLVFVIPFLGWLLGLGVIALWIIGILGALSGERKPVPILGEKFQEWFKSIEA
ncbi:putative membrane protein [Bernardetia litoralis DSM 6794]|uniref:Putative membrane protein n=1 Tax=Bernardetia litoralis (strain ATCC 23117 / DSM 6794 / NBRC 15988 / NCIMB 1366 / Fx l1 / Sio-4) TaxID=880071 RepID=I4AGZ2_BERLS|nr:hypothetical protein [Bernardetia litoralis]AFM03227.1 putative membrane protein [Bernardetia litoralis DSM 6794]